ncbi:cytochrome c oxidase subunit 1 [Deinococcus caeni]|uniref:Cytochrome c oxidase subunit 1 n=2 Tax=Deinococcus caeni TaxID=569127 RepID=A0ABP9UAH1_9DEIO
MLFALGMHWQGLAGVPRRAQVSASAQQAAYDGMNIALPKLLTALSGGVLFVAAILFYTVLIRTLLSPRQDDPESTPIPTSEAISPAGPTLHGASLLVRRTEPLLALTFAALVLVILVYGPVIAPMLANYQFIPGQRLW